MLGGLRVLGERAGGSGIAFTDRHRCVGGCRHVDGRARDPGRAVRRAKRCRSARGSMDSRLAAHLGQPLCVPADPTSVFAEESVPTHDQARPTNQLRVFRRQRGRRRQPSLHTTAPALLPKAGDRTARRRQLGLRVRGYAVRSPRAIRARPHPAGSLPIRLCPGGTQVHHRCSTSSTFSRL